MDPIDHLLEEHREIMARVVEVRAATAKEIIELLDSHFAKEEQILFPLARQVLDPPTKGSVAAAMEGMR